MSMVDSDAVSDPMITIHASEPHLPGAPGAVWRPPDGEHQYTGSGRHVDGKLRWTKCGSCGKRQSHRSHGRPWRTCSYCGSIHPADLIDLGVDPRDGRHADLWESRRVHVGPTEWADWKYGYPHKLYVRHPAGMIKFYSRHLLDHPELVEAFNERFGCCGVIFNVDDAQGLGWRRASVAEMV